MSISSIIVTYQPKISEISELLFSNLPYLNQIVVVDNGSSNIEELKKIINKEENVQLIELHDNLGIATAQNIAIQNLDVPDDEIIVFFDQDSSVNSLFITALESEYCSLECIYKAPIILGPDFFHRIQKFEYPVVKFDYFGFRNKIYPSNYQGPVEASCIISSGMCVRKRVLDLVGQMDSSLFIDYVDTEWCLRAKSKGVKIFVSPNVVMEHEIGNDNIKFIRWRIPVHSATRRYYRIRNSFKLLTYRHVPFIVCLHEITFSIAHQFFLVLFSKDKLDYLSSLYRGVKDGLFSLVGKNSK